MNKVYTKEKDLTNTNEDCGCKGGKTADGILKETSKKTNTGFTNWLMRILTFSFFLVLTPFILIYFIWAAFKMIVLNKNVDIKKALLAITKGRTDMTPDYEYDDDYDELVMMDVEDISEQYRK